MTSDAISARGLHVTKGAEAGKDLFTHSHRSLNESFHIPLLIALFLANAAPSSLERANGFSL
jgi:hypothetical protein